MDIIVPFNRGKQRLRAVSLETEWMSLVQHTPTEASLAPAITKQKSVAKYRQMLIRGYFHVSTSSVFMIGLCESIKTSLSGASPDLRGSWGPRRAAWVFKVIMSSSGAVILILCLRRVWWNRRIIESQFSGSRPYIGARVNWNHRVSEGMNTSRHDCLLDPSKPLRCIVGNTDCLWIMPTNLRKSFLIQTRCGYYWQPTPLARQARVECDRSGSARYRS